MFSTLLWLPVAAALPSLMGRADTSCSFSQKFSLDVSAFGFVQQIHDGQVVTGNGTNCLTLQISSNGGVTDQSGRECYISKPQMQFQCESSPPSAVVSASTGFCVANNLFAFNGNTAFYSCDTGNGTRNLYTESVSSMACEKVTVNVEGENCQPRMVTSSCPSPSTVTQTSTVVSTQLAQTVVNTVTAKAQTVVNTATVTQSAQTVVNTATVTASAQTVVNTATVTESAQTVVSTATVTQSAQTVVNTVTAKAQTITATVTTVVTSQVTEQAQTVTQEQTQQAQTVTEKVTAVKTEVVTKAAQSSATTCSPTTTLYPSTILPVATGKSFGPSYFLSAGNGNTSFITFNIPSSVSGTCFIDLEAPPKDQLQTSNYSFSGSGDVKICMTSSVVSGSTNFDSAPSTSQCFTKSVTEGEGSVNFGTFPCPSGQASFSVSTTGSFHLMMFEDYNPPPVGVVLAACSN